MGVRNIGTRQKPKWLIDFRYTNTHGKSVRYRKLADFQTKGGADAQEKRLLLHIAQHGEPYEEHGECMTFGEFVDKHWWKWSETRYKPTTQRSYASVIKRDALPFLGEMRIDEITTSTMEAYVREYRSRGVVGNHKLIALAAVLRYAERVGVIQCAPKLPKLGRKRCRLPDCPDTAESKEILAVTTGWLHTAVALAVLAGLRTGEIRALRVMDVDFVHKRLLIRHAMSQRVMMSTKTDRERSIPIAQDLIPILREACQGKTDRDWVVTSSRGPLLQSTLYDQFRIVLARNGLRPRSVHSLRHAFCSMLLDRGASIELVRTVAGHSDIATTGVYLHARADDALRFMGSGWAAEGCGSVKSLQN